MHAAAEALRALARDCELNAAGSAEHVDWQKLDPTLRHAIQQEVLSGLAFALGSVADVLDPQESDDQAAAA